MSRYRLRSFELSPPGAYRYEQPPPKTKRFGPEPVVEALGKQVWGYRMGNGLPRATLAEALEDISEYNCRRLGNDSRYCVEVQNGGQQNSLPLQADTPGLVPCRGCGAKVT